jgi:hypothetical protein
MREILPSCAFELETNGPLYTQYSLASLCKKLDPNVPPMTALKDRDDLLLPMHRKSPKERGLEFVEI